MKPADFRNATWREVLTHLTEDIVRVHLAWQQHGPGTTREVAQRSGISLLTLRPRTTDLYKLGLVELDGPGGDGGIYSARTREAAYLSAVWQDRADFRRKAGDEPEPSRTGFTTVDEAVDSLSPAEQASLGARLMGKWGHLHKKRETTSVGAKQLYFLTA